MLQNTIQFIQTIIKNCHFPFSLGGMLDLDRLISKTYSLEQINEAYAEMLTGGMARGVIIMDDSALE